MVITTNLGTLLRGSGIKSDGKKGDTTSNSSLCLLFTDLNIESDANEASGSASDEDEEEEDGGAHVAIRFVPHDKNLCMCFAFRTAF